MNNKLFCIYRRDINICNMCLYNTSIYNPKCYILTVNEEDAINKFIRTKEFYEFLYHRTSNIVCNVCNKYYIDCDMTAQLEHYRSHMENTIKYFKRQFDNNFVCVKVMSYKTDNYLEKLEGIDGVENIKIE